MYLKSLELKGFKSFAQRTELQFVTGITAVVGPNGSGKSNISDAIRWVLGEQSARALRGAKMEDIIFAGSDHLKPLNFGEVSLTLDNSDHALPIDYQEVMVTRRLYRSGESEYFINRQACRLKDIIELFMDTGLGKEAYSVIGQGRVEQILSSKPEERRILFEEAAGIVKYKTRKREAEKKLEQTEQNLIRLADIRVELEERLGPLTEQAEKAKQYQVLRNQLEATDVGLYVYQIEDVHGKWEQAREQVAQLQRQVNEETTRLRQLEREYESLRLQYHRLESAQDDHQHQLLTLSETMEKLEGQREVLRERIRNHQALYEEKEGQREELRLKQSMYQQELNVQHEYLKQCEAQYAEKKAALEREERNYQQLSQSNLDVLERLKGDYIELLNRMAAYRNELRNSEENLQRGEGRSTRLQGEEAGMIAEQAEFEKRLQVAEQELTRLNQQLLMNRSRLEELAEKRSQIEEEKRKTTLLMQEVSTHLEQVRSKHEVLKEWHDSFSGFMQGVREVLKERDRSLRGIHGAVAELIQVPPQLEVAMETALGAGLQNIVVEDEEAGREAIQLLKARRAGRATFLPLTVIKPRRLSQHEEGLLRSLDGVLGRGSQLLETNPRYRSIVEHLLGNVVIVENLDVANQVARLLRYRYRIVTLEGDVVNPGGAMTGGSMRQKSNQLLGRQRQLDELANLIQRAKTKQEEFQATLRHQAAQLKSLSQQEEEVRLLIEEAQQLRLQKETIRNQIQLESRNQQERLEVYRAELEQLHEEVASYEERLKLLRSQLAALELESEALKEEIEAAEQQRREQEVMKEERSQMITQLKVDVAAQAEHVRNLHTQVKQLEETVAELEKEEGELMAQLEQGEVAASRWTEELDELGRTLEELRQKRAQLEATIGQGKSERLQTKDQMDQLEEQVRQCNLQLKKLEAKLHQVEVQVNRFDVELDNALSHLREEYHMSYELAKERYPLPADVEEAKRQVQQLKRSLTQLGTVNHGAIEELQELEERYQFLTVQHEDLVAAKTSLYQVIGEMNEEMSRRFVESFALIREQFQLIFTQLFGGGKADLMLTAEEDILNTGVDIMAQPPGKKLQHLSLLSGGEKALTAIALLFAILKIKPVPFCVLDEVEAALDEANVIRFAQFLRHFSEETQFIVVTHRKGTMEGADVLYGVTMEESGVSKLVSVRLDEGWEMSAS